MPVVELWYSTASRVKSMNASSREKVMTLPEQRDTVLDGRESDRAHGHAGHLQLLGASRSGDLHAGRRLLPPYRLLS